MRLDRLCGGGLALGLVCAGPPAPPPAGGPRAGGGAPAASFGVAIASLVASCRELAAATELGIEGQRRGIAPATDAWRDLRRWARAPEARPAARDPMHDDGHRRSMRVARSRSIEGEGRHHVP